MSKVGLIFNKVGNLIKLTRKELANLGKTYRKEDKTRSYIEDIVKVNRDFVDSTIVSTKIEENLYIAIINTLAKKDFAVSGKTNSEVLKITAMLKGSFTKINNITKEETTYKENTIVVEYIKEEDTTVIQTKDTHLKYIHLSLMKDYLDENDFLYTMLEKSYNQNFIIKFPEPNIKNIYAELFEYEYGSLMDKIYLKNKAMDLIFYALKNCKEKTSLDFLNNEDLIRIEKAKTVIDESYDEKLTISSIAKKVALNEFKLKKGFKEVYQNTVHAYLKNVRLEKSVELLKTKNFSVKEVSIKVGYSTQSSFTYAFSQKFNCLPKEFLK